MSKRFRSCNLNQPFLLPPSLQNWLAEPHLARFVADVTNELDLSTIDAEYERKDGRRLAVYHPLLLVRLLELFRFPEEHIPTTHELYRDSAHETACASYVSIDSRNCSAKDSNRSPWPCSRKRLGTGRQAPYLLAKLPKRTFTG